MVQKRFNSLSRGSINALLKKRFSTSHFPSSRARRCQTFSHLESYVIMCTYMLYYDIIIESQACTPANNWHINYSFCVLGTFFACWAPFFTWWALNFLGKLKPVICYNWKTHAIIESIVNELLLLVLTLINLSHFLCILILGTSPLPCSISSRPTGSLPSCSGSVTSTQH